jgi:hypothetical protein
MLRSPLRADRSRIGGTQVESDRHHQRHHQSSALEQDATGKRREAAVEFHPKVAELKP